MNKLLKKEFSLAMHPITPMMLLLSAMVLIPNYPYTVVFFYISLALFFTCLLGRENNDIVYSLNLPVSKKSIVKARFTFSVIVELIQLAVMIPLCILSQSLNTLGNQAGMDANITLFGYGFIIYGVFNFIFFTSYYKNVYKVGVSFVKSNIAVFFLVALDVALTYVVPYVRDVLDTNDSEFVAEKLLFTGISLAVYVILTFSAYKLSVKGFEAQDIS